MLHGKGDNMYEIRFHGRGGQGAVTSAELLAQCAISQDKFAQAFPSFGPERRGAPVMAFSRIDDKPIKNRTAIYEPDIIIILDPSLYKVVEVTKGLKQDGWVIINSPLSSEEVKKELKWEGKVAVVNANQISREEIGRVITNTTLLGSLLKAVPLVNLDKIKEKIKERFGNLAEKNIKAFDRAYNETKIEEA